MDGLSLYKSLNENYRVLIIAPDKERADIWLKTNNLSKSLDDIIQLSDTIIDDKKLATVEAARSKGKVDFVITDDTELTKKLLEKGINVLMFLSPRYIRPEFRPDGRSGAKTWDEITQELDKQQGLYDHDQRLSSLDEVFDEG